MEGKLEGDTIARGWEGFKPSLVKKYQCVSNTDHWLQLQTIPTWLNGSQLSAEEFRDNLRLQDNLKPLGMQQTCDGCGK